MPELVKVDKEIEQIRQIVDYEYIYKLVKDDKIIGYGTINKDKENLIYIYIEEGFRENGYGELLFSKMLEEAKQLEYKEVKVRFKYNNIQILRIVEKVGGLHLSSNENVVKYLIPLK